MWRLRGNLWGLKGIFIWVGMLIWNLKTAIMRWEKIQAKWNWVHDRLSKTTMSSIVCTWPVGTRPWFSLMWITWTQTGNGTNGLIRSSLENFNLLFRYPTVGSIYLTNFVNSGENHYNELLSCIIVGSIPWVAVDWLSSVNIEARNSYLGFEELSQTNHPINFS